MSATTAAPRDAGLTLPLSGVHLIEASAGTGKTFTLMTLALRLLLERGIGVRDLAAVTYTIAATQELRERLRRRLRLAERLLDADAPHASEGEEAATFAVLQVARASVGDVTVRTRLAAALLQLDEAQVSTIHGFCHRALREHGFRAGTLAEGELVEEADDVWSEVAADLWRVAITGGDAALRALLAQAWKTPDALAQDLPKLCDPARRLYPAAEDSDTAAALHRLRADASRRFDAAMATHGLRSFDQLVEQVWRASEDPDFVRALARRWPVLLVDEFQDTDPRQWDIFRRLFEAGACRSSLPFAAGEGEEPRSGGANDAALFLIGDPKQAIYRFRGGDLATYLRARAYAQQHGSVVALDANYRSRPAVLQAVETVFTAHAAPFVDADIRFHPVRAAGKARDGDLQVNGKTPPGLTLHWLPAHPDNNGLRDADTERAMMRAAAVAAIAELLAHGTLHGAPLRPRDIAVLTQTNAQAADMQRALAQAGIGAATLSSADVFAREAAEDLQRLLESLAAPADPARQRAALATRLLGFDAQALLALDEDEAAARDIGQRFEAAADAWRQRGPLPALLPFLGDAAPRWLGMRDGPRRLTDALHLAELLQAQSSTLRGIAEQLAWFARMRTIALGDGHGGEEHILRLESDADLVQITTLHKSKGLEYPVVVLPFVAYKGKRPERSLRFDDIHDSEGLARVARCKGVLEPADAAVIDAHCAREEMAEAMRQLYVGLTRARHALHVVWSRNRTTHDTALHRLLHDGARTGRKHDKLDHTGMQARIEQLAAASAGSLAVRPFDSAQPPAAPAPQRRAETMLAARTPKRRLSGGAWLHSFSGLHALQPRADVAAAPARGADDEAQALEELAASPLAGTGFGNAVHAVLETADFTAWRGHVDGRVPPGEQARLERALRHHGLSTEAPAIAQTARLVGRALNAALPGGVRLCALPDARRVAELEFHVRLAPTRLSALHALLERHGYPRAAAAVPSALRIEGLMHGYIDLIYRDDAGRHHVVDYKTNRLPAYDAAALREAIRARDYDLQYLIYLVALQRWLRLRRGAAYDPARDLGGAAYLFLRGIDPQGIAASDDARSADAMNVATGLSADLFAQADTTAGVHIDRPPQALIDALDALFDGAAP